MKKGLLMLVGGRPMPNMLTIIHEKPDLIVAIVSKDYRFQIPLLQTALKEIFGLDAPELDATHEVNAFNANEIYAHCLLAVEQYPDLQWLFNITCGTAIMSIGAYEAARYLVAQGRSLRCWYLDTNHTNLVTLFGEGRDDEIFYISVEQYAATYGCRLQPGKAGNPELAKQWLPFVHFLISEPRYIDELQDILARAGLYNSAPGKRMPVAQYPLPEKAPLQKTPERSRLLAEAGKVNLVNNLLEQNGQISFSLTEPQAHFLSGYWLEAYVWSEATKKSIFSDCRWDLELFYAGLPEGKPGNQLDVSMIYKAQLFIIECKTGEKDFFEKETLDELDSTAQILGKGFVGKLLVASWPEKPYNKEKYDREKQEKVERFKERAKYLDIEIATRENLAEIGTIIEELVKKRRG